MATTTTTTPTTTGVNSDNENIIINNNNSHNNLKKDIIKSAKSSGRKKKKKRTGKTDLSVDDIVDSPRENDVLFGRGGNVYKHPGNQTFRSLVASNKAIYLTCSVDTKKKLAESIVLALETQDPPARFIQTDQTSGKWVIVDRRRAVSKTSQALREGAPDLRHVINNCNNTPEPPLPHSSPSSSSSSTTTTNKSTERVATAAAPPSPPRAANACLSSGKTENDDESERSSKSSVVLDTTCRSWQDVHRKLFLNRSREDLLESLTKFAVLARRQVSEGVCANRKQCETGGPFRFQDRVCRRRVSECSSSTDNHQSEHSGSESRVTTPKRSSSSEKQKDLPPTITSMLVTAEPCMEPHRIVSCVSPIDLCLMDDNGEDKKKKEKKGQQQHKTNDLDWPCPPPLKKRRTTVAPVIVAPRTTYVFEFDKLENVLSHELDNVGQNNDEDSEELMQRSVVSLALTEPITDEEEMSIQNYCVV